VRDSALRPLIGITASRLAAYETDLTLQAKPASDGSSTPAFDARRNLSRYRGRDVYE
jgi:hypothetical protein